jgi:PTH1 family peptidyl-tRNA hydrolase
MTIKSTLQKIREFKNHLMTNNKKVILIAGLGNPGKQYSETRHNIGFKVIDQLAQKLGVEFRRMQSKAMVTKAQYLDSRLILAKPRTFMNNSGQAVGALARFYKVPMENILVIYDDVDLDFESLRLRPDGRSSGQKGMDSVIRSLGTDQIPRLRIGIGRPPGRMETPDYVLRPFSADEKSVLPFIIDRAVDAILEFVQNDIDSAMNKFNQTSA